ncbi:TIGR03809 family protein [Nitrobacter sp. NHB1]|uniref:TIGR03809 family protein n=1 Tax=Nitrobacter sp. NHB1 TaxID=3119830 RepID=UPI002FFDB8BC
MTQRNDATHARKYIQDYAQDILERWCRIAEQRLNHLIELYESGRWRRYHSEHAFMENLREAKAAVETWRVLARREATPDDRAIDGAEHDQPAAASPTTQDMQDEVGQSPARTLGTAAVHAALASIMSSPEDMLVEANDDAPADEETASVAEWATGIAPDPRAFRERYPMLRYNTL